MNKHDIDNWKRSIRKKWFQLKYDPETQQNLLIASGFAIILLILIATN